MTGATFSLAILHAVQERRRKLSLAAMLGDLAPLAHGVPLRVVDEVRPPGRSWDEWQHEIHPRVWQWSLETGATHHIFMTDDLHIAPNFWGALGAMVTAHPGAIMGLLSNHPAGPRLALERATTAYRCNSWIVGPCYVVPRLHLEPFVDWYVRWIESVERRHYGDDSALNEWNSRCGPGESWHPLPTIIEHRGDLDSTWQSGDKFSRERVSWRAVRRCHDTGRALLWTSTDHHFDLEAMTRSAYWADYGPMLRVAGASEEEAESWHPRPEFEGQATP
jgi:hypothetical protein